MVRAMLKLREGVVGESHVEVEGRSCGGRNMLKLRGRAMLKLRGGVEG